MVISKILQVDARPEAVAVDFSETALLIVDMQNDFGTKGGMFDRIGVDLSSIRDTIEPTMRILDSARLLGLPVMLRFLVGSAFCSIAAECADVLLMTALGQRRPSPDVRKMSG